MANYFSIADIHSNATLEAFAYRSSLSTPCNAIHDGKVLKKKNKLQTLINHVGYYGPILDLVIRSTVNHLVITEFTKEARVVTNPENGDLLQLLKKYFSNDPILWQGIKCWFKYSKAVEDYEINFRNFRCEVCNSFASTISLRPQNKVRQSRYNKLLDIFLFV